MRERRSTNNPLVSCAAGSQDKVSSTLTWAGSHPAAVDGITTTASERGSLAGKEGLSGAGARARGGRMVRRDHGGGGGYGISDRQVKGGKRISLTCTGAAGKARESAESAVEGSDAEEEGEEEGGHGGHCGLFDL